MPHFRIQPDLPSLLTDIFLFYPFFVFYIANPAVYSTVCSAFANELFAVVLKRIGGISESEIRIRHRDNLTESLSQAWEENSYEKQEYLNTDFKLFHLTDIPAEEFEFHYHDFDKIIIFLSGHVDYAIEGRTYQLIPYYPSLCFHRASDAFSYNHHNLHV